MEIEVIDTKTAGDKVDFTKLFLFNNKLYNYYFRDYNNTSVNERKVEIPIIIDYIRKWPGAQILEVGNVLSHYFVNVCHDIVDKDEEAEHVINIDIVDYAPEKKYNLIVSISTLEHVGFEGDDGQYQWTPGHVQKAFSNLKALLEPGGELVFSVPLGYHHELDEVLESNEIGLSECYVLENHIKNNIWKQVSFKSIKNKPWNNFVQNVINKETNQVNVLRRIKYVCIGILRKEVVV